MKSKFVVATRRSALALAQSRAFIAELSRFYPQRSFEELHVITTGDRVLDRPLSEIGGKGLFVKEIEEALIAGRADLAVHSLKDVPPELLPELVLECYPRREDPRDVLISRSGSKFDALPSGARVGTSSLRRRVQLQARRPDLEYVSLRGNVDTRIRKCREGEFDAIVLARAGLVRLGRADEASELLSPELCLPAAGQGALAVEVRAADRDAQELLAPLSDLETALAVSAERGVLRAISGTCQTPVAAYALRQAAELWLRALLAEPDGSRVRTAELRVPWPARPELAFEHGLNLGRRLLSRP